MRDSKGRFLKGNPAPKTAFKKGVHYSLKTEFKSKGGLPKCKDCGKKLTNYDAIFCKLHVKAGDRSPSWKGGITTINYRLRRSTRYKLWRKAVYERDNYTCQICFKIGGELNADHIKPWALYPELRFDLNNGRTLCVSCHRRTETWGVNLRSG